MKNISKAVLRKVNNTKVRTQIPSSKTTLLRLINRLSEIDSGNILLNGEDIRDHDPIINQHFGKARKFIIIESDRERITVLEARENDPSCGTLEYGGHADDALGKSVSLISDCDAVLCSRIGGGAAEGLQSMGIEPVEAPGFIALGIELITHHYI